MSFQARDPRTTAQLVEKYYANPTPELGEELLTAFRPLIQSFFIYLCGGLAAFTGPPPRSVIRLAYMLNEDKLQASLRGYTNMDIMQVVEMCVLLAAQEKGYVANALPYYLRTEIGKMTRDALHKADWFQYDTVNVDDAVLSTIASTGDMEHAVDYIAYEYGIEDRVDAWLLARVAEGYYHREIADMLDEGEHPRRTVCSWVTKAREKAVDASYTNGVEGTAESGRDEVPPE